MEAQAPVRIWSEPLEGRLVVGDSCLGWYLDESLRGLGFDRLDADWTRLAGTARGREWGWEHARSLVGRVTV